jgi:hypothetical protein
VRAGDPKEAGEQIRVEGTLVVPERAEEERHDGAVLVAAGRRNRVGVERECRLVAVVARWIRGRDPQLECADGNDGAQRKQESRADGGNRRRLHWPSAGL